MELKEETIYDLDIDEELVKNSPFASKNEETNPFLQENGDLNEAVEMTRDLVKFEEGIFNIGTLSLMASFFQILKEVGAITPSIISKALIDTSTYIFLNLLGNSEEEAFFGIYDNFVVVFYHYLSSALTDKYGVVLSEAFGSSNSSKFKTIFTKSIFFSLTFFIVWVLPVMGFSRFIFVSMYIEEKKAEKVQEFTRLSLPLVILDLVGETFKTAILSQGIESIFGAISIVTTATIIPLNFYLIVTKELGIRGFLISKTVNQLMITLATLAVYWWFSHPQLKGFSSFRTALNGFCSFSADCVIFMISTAPQFIGFDILGFLVAIRNDPLEGAAYFSMMNFLSIIDYIGQAFSLICRTRINALIGLKKNLAAKNYYIFFMISTALFAISMVITIFVLRYRLASLFVGHSEESMYWFTSLAFYFLIFGCQPFLSLSAMIGMKSIGKVNLLVGLNFFFSGMATALGGFLCYRLGYMCDVQYAVYMVFQTLFTTTCLLVVSSKDWTQIGKNLEN